MRIYLLLLLLTPTTLLGSDADEASFKIKNRETGVFDTTIKLSDDKSKVTLAYRGDTGISTFNSVQAMSGSYGVRVGRPWVEFLYSQESGDFLSFAENSSQTSTRNSNAEGNFIRGNGDQISKKTLGAGVTYRYNTVGELFNSPKLFDLISAYLTYNQFNDNFRGKNFSGPGVLVTYAANYRLFKDWEIGPLFSYEIASVKRPIAGEGETSGDRSILIANMRMGLNLTLYWGEL